LLWFISGFFFFFFFFFLPYFMFQLVPDSCVFCCIQPCSFFLNPSQMRRIHGNCNLMQLYSILQVSTSVTWTCHVMLWTSNWVFSCPTYESRLLIMHVFLLLNEDGNRTLTWSHSICIALILCFQNNIKSCGSRLWIQLS
jgi:hypothetical protein